MCLCFKTKAMCLCLKTMTIDYVFFDNGKGAGQTESQ